MLILLVIGAVIVALTLAALGEDARHFMSAVHVAPRRHTVVSPRGTSEWSAAMRAFSVHNPRMPRVSSVRGLGSYGTWS